MEDASGPVLLRNWLEARSIYIEHLMKKATMLGGKVIAIFSRDEYQSQSGNLPHMHFVIVIDKSDMGPDAEFQLMDQIRASPWALVNYRDANQLIEEGLLKSIDEIPALALEAAKFTRHICNPRCQRRIGDGDGEENFGCRKMNNTKDTPDCSKHCLIDMPYKFMPEFNELMSEIGLCQIDNDTQQVTWQHPFFCPTRHMPPCVPNDHLNCSPATPESFIHFRSMVNSQWVGGVNTIAKYILKYVCKFDQTERVETKANNESGAIQTGSQFLHNTKISSSAINEAKAFQKKRNSKHPTGRVMPDLEIYHQLSGEADVVTNLKFIKLSTQSFEIRQSHKISIKRDDDQVNRNASLSSEGITVRQDIARNRVAYNGSSNDCPDHNFDQISAQNIRAELNMPQSRQFTFHQREIVFDDSIEKRSYDKISEFGIRAPELTSVVDMPKQYFRWFEISNKNTSPNEVKKNLSRSFRYCRWYDGFCRRIRVRKGALHELASYVEKNLITLQSIRDELRSEGVHSSIEFNEQLASMLRIFIADDEDLNPRELQYKRDMYDEFVHDDNGELLPIVVMSQINPMNTVQWVTHLILSMGRYVTEKDAFDHPSLYDCFVAAKLIGSESDEDSKKQYAKKLLRRYILEQIIFYPISLSTAQRYILRARDIIESIVMHDEIPMFEVPSTMAEVNEAMESTIAEFWTKNDERLLDAVYHSLKDANVPSRDDVESTKRTNPIEWDPLSTFEQACGQSDASFQEQKLAIELIKLTILKYCAPLQGRRVNTYVKNILIEGFPGAGKSFLVLMAVLFGKSQGLRVITTAIMAARADSLGGMNLHLLFGMKSDRNPNSRIHPMREAEKALEKIRSKPHLMNTLLTVDVLIIDEFGKVPPQLLIVFDVVLRAIRKSSILYGGVLIIGSIDHAQPGPIKDTPTLLSSHMLSSYTAVQLHHSVRAQSDAEFQRFQQIVREDPYVLLENEDEMKAELFDIGRRIFTYAANWDDPRISPNAHCIFPTNEKVRQAINGLVGGIRRKLDREGIDYFVVRAEDQSVRIGSSMNYREASPQTTSMMNNKFREPEEIVLFRFGVYEVTANHPQRLYLHTSQVVLYDMPDQAKVQGKRNIKFLLKPSHIQHIEWLDTPDISNYPSKEVLIGQGWKEVSIGASYDRNPVVVNSNFLCKRRQYTLRHVGASTIDHAQGMTITTQVATEITQTCKPWLKPQGVVIFSRSNTANQMIIVGQCEVVLQILWELIVKPTQWTIHVSRILHMLSINSEGDAPDWQRSIDLGESHPFRIVDITLPNDTTGFVYLLASFKDPSYTYIGECENVTDRFEAHSRGHGSYGTSLAKHPLFVAAYITGLKHMDSIKRKSLESFWKRERDRIQGHLTVLNIIEAGERVVQVMNSGDHLQKIVLVKRVGM